MSWKLSVMGTPIGPQGGCSSGQFFLLWKTFFSYQDKSASDAACTLCPLTSLCGSVLFVATQLVMEYCDEPFLEFSFLQKDKILLFQSFLTRQVLQNLERFWLFLWPFSRPPLCLFWMVGTRTGNRAPGAAWQALRRVEWSWLCYYCL